MDIRSATLVCFSPTGTSRAVLEAVARGLAPEDAELVDITRPEARERRFAARGLLVVAVPVYVGRIPAQAREWLEAQRLDKTPVVGVVVYGNRAFEDALLELTDLVRERGGVPVAGAAFIGEHSFSGPDTPIAVARPDAADLRLAEDFGRRVRAAVSALAGPDAAPKLSIPGNRPYRELMPPVLEPFMTVGEECLECGVCAEACPVGAIDAAAGFATDTARCIYCCACIKACPEGARVMTPSWLKDIAVRLSQNCAARREPECFLPST